MAANEVRFDPQEFSDAVVAQGNFVFGLWLYGGMIVLLVAVAVLGGSNFPVPSELGIAVHVIGASTIIFSALRARKALGLSVPGIVIGGLFSIVVPCLMLALIISLMTRFSRYFEAWRLKYGLPHGMPRTDYLSAVATPKAPVTTIETPGAAAPLEDRFRISEELERLAALRTSGGLTEEEFESAKRRLLGIP